jgi:hypothetical protein
LNNSTNVVSCIVTVMYGCEEQNQSQYRRDTQGNLEDHILPLFQTVKARRKNIHYIIIVIGYRKRSKGKDALGMDENDI